MPTYCYQCATCEKQEEVFHWVRPEPVVPPECCALPMERDWHVEHGGHKPASAFPFVTTNLNGKPIEVKSAAHYKELQKEHGVRLRDDVGYIEDRVEHQRKLVRLKNGQLALQDVPTLIHGKGNGLPGSWI